MGGAKKLHVGFPEKALDKYLKILTDNGFKVAVVEQTETPKMLKEREISQRGMPTTKADKVVKREICNIVTKGTFKDKNEQGFEPKYVLAFKRQSNTIGVTFFDLSTL